MVREVDGSYFSDGEPGRMETSGIKIPNSRCIPEKDPIEAFDFVEVTTNPINIRKFLGSNIHWRTFP